jgi:uncharacterized membrane protein YGL010W
MRVNMQMTNIPLNIKKNSIPIGFGNLIKRLRSQHNADLQVYRSAHREWKNLALHWLLIPVECWSALQFFWILAGLIARAFVVIEKVIAPHCGGVHGSSLIIGCHIVRSIPRVVTGLLGSLSLLIADDVLTGIASFCFHVFLIQLCDGLMQLQTEPQKHDHCHYQQDLWEVSAIAGLSWTLAWIVQVGVGHGLFEKNIPNIANSSDIVSYLAMCQSVLIAWSS